MRRRRAALALPAAGLAALALAGCGTVTAEDIAVTPSGSVASAVPATEAATPAASPAPATPAAAAPSTVPASAVPAVSGALGSKPRIAAGTATAPTSLLVHDVAVGHGPAAVDGDTLTVQYVGTFYANGKQFDASWDRGQAFPFPLGERQVITGWDQGLVGMKAGGRRELVIPPALAYGPDDYNGIPGGSTLVFVIDLVSVSQG